MFKDKLFNKKALNYIMYVLSIVTTVLIMVFLIKIQNINDFFTSMENRTFDLRQSMLAKYKKHNDDIVILAIDDPSYEYLLGKYGEFPIPRDVYAKIVDYLELQKPKAIAFDLMFVQSMKSKSEADAALAKMFKKYNNVYTAMNFDAQPSDVRIPIDLPKKLSVNVRNDSPINLLQKGLKYSNCRAILPQIIEATSNIGLINASRSEDGILRKMPPFVNYKNQFYPHLAILVGLNSLAGSEKIDKKNFYIDKNSNIKIGKRSIPVDKDGGVILNWYGETGDTFKHIPFYHIEKAMKGDKTVPKYDLKDKIIYVGVTAVSLFDIKSVPVGKVYPGVELHATYINNLLDNNFIKKVPDVVNICVSIFLALMIGLIVIKSSSTMLALASSLGLTFCYIVISYLLMMYFNLWLAIVLPVLVVILTFISAYIVKYLLKSRDFEHQYKLATTDGLTELYNHRYFQEQMLMQIENCKRYNSHFSLILIDIDFFKKFNDTYGHQAGDAVLKQVAYALKKNVRTTDIVCRYGGEEMSIILTNTDKDEAIITAQKICQAVSQKPFKIGIDLETPVTISLGVATFPQDGQRSNELIENADKGLYKAKENGRNQVGL